jgi:hypothetical protein
VIRTELQQQRRDVAAQILERVRAQAVGAVNKASAAGVEEAKAVIVREGRVKSGTMRDGNKVRLAGPTPGGAAGGFYNDVSYALYHELGTRRIRAIRFMEIGAKAAAKRLKVELVKIIRGEAE